MSRPAAIFTTLARAASAGCPIPSMPVSPISIKTVRKNADHSTHPQHSFSFSRR